MAGHGKYSAGPGAVPFPKMSFGHKWISKALGGAMWFWIFWRVREEGPVMLGWRHPWDHGHDDHHDDGHH
ncbi:hypothetical protein TRVA0_027S01794 [Trichomonascus vanleenenianus]|uniref:uncharacterized protein n=1 Tax=Trichomonascus vanleenenianus TaxID=2268995 RepID=UPI003EC9D78D